MQIAAFGQIGIRDRKQCAPLLHCGLPRQRGEQAGRRRSPKPYTWVHGLSLSLLTLGGHMPPGAEKTLPAGGEGGGVGGEGVRRWEPGGAALLLF